MDDDEEEEQDEEEEDRDESDEERHKKKKRKKRFREKKEAFSFSYLYFLEYMLSFHFFSCARESEKHYVLDEDDYELLQDNNITGFHRPKPVSIDVLFLFVRIWCSESVRSSGL